MKKISVLMALIMAVFSVSCATSGAKTTTSQKADSVSTEDVIAANTATVKILGRTFTQNDVLYLTQSASAVEFTAHTKSLSVLFVGDATARPSRASNVPTNYARYAIYVDGEQTEVGSIDNAKKTVSIFSGNTVRDAVVRIVKLTESAQSVFGIKGFALDGSIRPLEEKSLKIEFIGDSITCGYGVEAQSATESFTTQTENAEKAYAYLTAQALNADYSIVSYSGHGIYSGYTGDGNINTQSLVPPLYDKVGFSYQDASLTKREWNFADFVPSIVVINLGTNDASYCKTPALRGKYVDAYVDFLKLVREKNPAAQILCTLGIMGDELYPSLQTAVQTYSSQTGDTNVVAFHFAPQNPSADGIGADYHPSAKTQSARAEALVSFIKSLQN